MKAMSKLFLILFFTAIYVTSPTYLCAQESNSVIIVGTDYAYYPYEFINEYNHADGFDIDIIKAIGKEINATIEFKPGSWLSVKKELESGEIDLLAGMFYHADRAKRVNFSMPYIIITHSIFVKEGDYWQSLADVKDQENLKVVVENSSILHQYLNNAGIASNRILPVENQLDALKIISKTPNTCALMPHLQGKYVASKYGFEDIVTVGLPILPREYSVAVNINDTLLLGQINDAITQIHLNGTYDKIYTKWFGDYDNSRKKSFELSLSETIFILLFLIISIVFIVLYLRSKKNIQKKEVQLFKSEYEKIKTINHLSKQESLYKNGPNNTPFPFVVIKLDGTIKHANKMFEMSHGSIKKEKQKIQDIFALLVDTEVYSKSLKVEFENKLSRVIEGNESDKKSGQEIKMTFIQKNEMAVEIHFISLGDGSILLIFEDIKDQIIS